MKKRLFILIGAAFITVNGFSQLLSETDLMSKVVYKKLDEALKAPEQVYRLDLTKCKVLSSFKEYKQFVNLQELTIKRKKLDSIPDGVFDLVNLQMLNLTKNRISKLDTRIGEMVNLRELKLGDNLIPSLPKEIKNLQDLKNLELWANEIDYFPKEISQLKKLRQVDLRLITMNKEKQNKIKQLLPDARIRFDPYCNCSE